MELIKEAKEDIKIRGKEDVFNYLEEFRDEDREYFIVIGLNNKNKVMYREITNIGCINESLTSPTTVFRGAVMKGVRKIIIAHNHPSGEPEPSDADIKTSKKLKEAGEILEIEVLDSIIIGDDESYSMLDEGDI